MTVLAAQIRAARAFLNWSQDELAARAGTSRRSVYAVESDTQPIAAETMDALIAALETAGVKFLKRGSRVGLMGPGKPD